MQRLLRQTQILCYQTDLLILYQKLTLQFSYKILTFFLMKASSVFFSNMNIGIEIMLTLLEHPLQLFILCNELFIVQQYEIDFLLKILDLFLLECISFDCGVLIDWGLALLVVNSFVVLFSKGVRGLVIFAAGVHVAVCL